MAPNTFSGIHIFILLMAAAVVLLLFRTLNQKHRKVYNYGASALIGMFLGMIFSYFSAHLVTHIMKSVQFGAIARIDEGNRLFFWTLFVGFSCIGAIAGGLTGILFAKNREKGEENVDE